MLCNLAYAPPFRWYIENIPFEEIYEIDRLAIDMDEATKKAQGEFWNSIKFILYTNDVFQKIGFGKPDVTEKLLSNGDINLTMHSLTRKPWQDPDPRVILYSLYKFAEECGGTYQFTLSDLLDDEVQRDGISPTRIFGISREEMIPILNGLSVNYPDFISATFSLNLEKITLKEDKTAEDVLAIF